MLRTFAAALLATTLVAGSAFAAQPAGTAAGTTPAASTAATPAAPAAKIVAAPTKPVKTVKHVRKHTHKRVAANMKIKTHKGHVARNGKPVKINTTAKKAA
jgi:curli biogenesis system outer membrane secretion channel CsgG